MEDRNRLFKKLVEQDKDFLMRRAARLTYSREDAEDLVHDTIVLADKGFHRFRRESSFRSWAARIMLNHHINNMRRKESKNVLVEDFSTGKYDPLFFRNKESTPGMENPEEVFMKNNTDKHVMEAYFRMNEEHRRAFSLFHFDGYSYEEIARAMDIPIGTVKSKIHRARGNMVENLREIGSEVNYELSGGRV